MQRQSRNRNKIRKQARKEGNQTAGLHEVFQAEWRFNLLISSDMERKGVRPGPTNKEMTRMSQDKLQILVGIEGRSLDASPFGTKARAKSISGTQCHTGLLFCLVYFLFCQRKPIRLACKRQLWICMTWSCPYSCFICFSFALWMNIFGWLSMLRHSRFHKS